MNVNKNTELSSVSKAGSYEAIGEYWDTHSLDDHWDETNEVDFDVRAKRRHRVTVDPEVYEQVAVEARTRGLRPETLINVWLAERVSSESLK